MKVRIEVVEDEADEEIIIRCVRVDETVQRIQQYAKNRAAGNVQITFYKDNQEYYFPVGQILFFETEGEYVYGHTVKDTYRTKYRLYELEELLPAYFTRASKSAVINSRQVYSITKNLTASSLVTFHGSHKHVYVSRNYYQKLRQMMRKEISI